MSAPRQIVKGQRATVLQSPLRSVWPIDEGSIAMGDGINKQSAWPALAILTGIYACHSLDRAVVSVVVEPLKRDLNLSDGEIGIVAGLGYGLAFAAASLPVGALVDRVNRVRLLATLGILWSTFTAVAGLSQSLLGLALARMGVGAAEAGGQPTALSIISDKFDEDRRATAIGVFYVGASLGYAASFFGGGLVAQAYGWRAAFFIAGVPGAILSVLLLALVREPRRSGGPVLAVVVPTFSDTIRTIFRRSGLRHLYAAMTLAAFSVATVFAWMVPLMMRDHGLTLPAAGLAAGITMGVAQAIGALSAGKLADRLMRRSRAAMLWVPAGGLLITVPLALGFALSPPRAAVICLVAFGFFSTCWTAAGFSAALGQVEGRMRGRALGLLQLLTTLLGASLAPFVVGVLSDRIGGPQSLAVAIAALTPVGAWSAMHFVLAGRAMDREPVVLPPHELAKT